VQLVVQAGMLLHLKVEAVVVESSIRDRNIPDLDSSLLLIAVSKDSFVYEIRISRHEL